MGVMNINLRYLDKDQVKNLLVVLLDAEVQGCESLARIISLQTDGNLFYIVQFIKWLQQSDLLSYVNDHWEWDIEEIALTAHPSRVADFVRVKVMDHLTAETK
jgi:predicted ATPase